MSEPRLFSFKIVHEDMPRRRLQARSLHVMVSFFMLFYGLQYLMEPELNWIQLIALLPPSLLIVILVIFKRRLFDDPGNNRIFRILEMGFLLMGSMHFLQRGSDWTALLYLGLCTMVFFLLKMESRIFQAQYIDFSEDEALLELPLRDRKLSWTQIASVTLKNHYLTFHLKEKGNRQFRVDDQAIPFSIADFLAFCEKKTSA